MEDSSSQSYFRRHFEDLKEFWSDRLYIYGLYLPMIRGEVPSWSSSDLEEFIASHPVQGHALKTARETVKFSLPGSVIGAVSTAGFAWKYSRSVHGAGLSFLAGGVFGWTFGSEIGNHWYQTYRVDHGAPVKFMEWWINKNKRDS